MFDALQKIHDLPEEKKKEMNFKTLLIMNPNYLIDVATSAYIFQELE
ncbi:MAG: hypothetical protein IJU79_03880 [Desulfovibrionaceae bacterium]|nr:hypothetical protein [Desulfovibrionaceae bacterium]